MKNTIALFALMVAALAFAGPLRADESIKAQLLKSFDGIEKKVVSLAEAMPADKFSWRPMEGVRSYSEVCMHIAAASYAIAGALGPKPPASVDVGGLEKNVTAKADVVKQLKDALAFARNAIESTPDSAMGDAVKLFGSASTKGGVMLALVEHSSEHLGQSIAYARMNKVAPPWSR